MTTASMRLRLLSDGAFKVDGGAMFGRVPKTSWETWIKPDRRNRVRLGINCLLIQSPEGSILVDTGSGAKEDEAAQEAWGLGPARAMKALRDVGVDAKDVRFVLLSTLRLLHAGGATRLSRSGEMVPAFPSARYLVQGEALRDAQHPDIRDEGAFRAGDYCALQEHEQLDLLDGDCEVVPGVWVKAVGGPSRGHQIVLINRSGCKAAFLGDLVPTPYHLPLAHIGAFDRSPEKTQEWKRELLNRLESEGWLLIFTHGMEGTRAGYLERRNGSLCLRPVEV